MTLVEKPMLKIKAPLQSTINLSVFYTDHNDYVFLEQK